MVEFINSFGGIMRVAENRVEEYKAAGYKLAATPVTEPIEAPKIQSEEKPKKAVRKRTTKK